MFNNKQLFYKQFLNNLIMKNLILISALVLSVVSTVFSQTPNDRVFKIGEDINSVNTGYLEQMIFKKINSYLLDKGIPQLSFDKSTYKSADYQGKFFNKYVEYRSYSTDEEPVDNLILKTKQERLDYFSDEEGVDRRMLKDFFSSPCVNCGLDERYRMTYDEYSDDFLEYFLRSESDIISLLSSSKYMGVSVNFSIEGINIYMLTITIVTSTNSSDTI